MKATVTPRIALKEARTKRGLTQSAVAERIGIDQGQYARIEAGAGTSPETAAKIAAMFSPEITELHLLYPERFGEAVRAA